MKSIIDEIYTAMVKGKKEYSNAQILQEFFKIDFENAGMAKKIVEPLLQTDARFRKTENNSWTAVKTVALEDLPIEEVTFILFYIEDIEKTTPVRELESSDIFSFIKKYSSFILYKGGIVDYELDVKDVLRHLGRFIFVPYDRRSLGYLHRLYRVISPLDPEVKTLSIRSLISELFPQKKLKTWEDIVEEFKIRNIYSERPSAKTKTLRYILEYLLTIVRERGIKTAGELVEYSHRGRKKVDFSRYGFEKDFLMNIPEMPGVYQFYDQREEIIYVGKTNNLKHRINSYFWNTGESVEKIKGILEQLYSIQYRVLGSDLEALIEEYRLINEHKPRYNKMVNIPEKQVSVSNKILLLPSNMQRYIKLYFLSEKIPLIGYDFDCSGLNKDVIDILNRMEGSREDIFDPLKIIALFYLRRYEERLNTVEIDRYPSAQDVLNVLYMHCRHPEEIGREKSIYL